MGCVRVGHEKAVRSDLGDATMLWRPGVKRGVLAHHGAIAHFKARLIALFISEHLRWPANDRSRINLNVRA